MATEPPVVTGRAFVTPIDEMGQPCAEDVAVGFMVYAKMDTMWLPYGHADDKGDAMRQARKTEFRLSSLSRRQGGNKLDG